MQFQAKLPELSSLYQKQNPRCRWQTARRICANAVAWLTSLNTSSHVLPCRSWLVYGSSRVLISREEPVNLRGNTYGEGIVYRVIHGPVQSGGVPGSQ